MFKFFPFYINIQNKYFLIAGGGKIACRRLKTLLKFDVNVILVATDISSEIKSIDDSRLKLYEQDFEEKFLEGIDYLILATNDKKLHESISRLARGKGITVNDASCKENCDFYFPSIIDKDELLISVTSLGNNHKLTHRIANIIRKYLDKFTK